MSVKSPYESKDAALLRVGCFLESDCDVDSTFIYTLHIASQVPVRVGVRLCMSNQSTGLLGQTLVPIQAQYQRAISRLIQVSNPLPLKPS